MTHIAQVDGQIGSTHLQRKVPGMDYWLTWGTLGPSVRRMARDKKYGRRFIAKMLDAQTCVRHAFAMVLYAQPGPLDDAAAWARRFLEEDVFTLLRRAYPGRSVPSRRLLDRCGQTIVDASRYRRLMACVQDPKAVLWLTRRQDPLNERSLEICEALSALHPTLAPFFKVLPETAPMMTGLNMVVEALQAAGRSPSASEWRWLADGTRRHGGVWLVRQLLTRLAPSERKSVPPVATPLLRQITGTHELADLGRRFRNCLGGHSYAEALLFGESLFFEWTGSEPAAVELRRELAGWSVHEIRGRGNARIGEDARRIEQELRNAGITLVPSLSRVFSVLEGLTPGRGGLGWRDHPIADEFTDLDELYMATRFD